MSVFTVKRFVVFAVLVSLFATAMHRNPSFDSRSGLDFVASQYERVKGLLGGGEGESVRVLRVVDGDTVVVSLDGRDAIVRYIGVDTPETKKPGVGVECGGPEATAYNRQLVDGRQVVLTFGPERTDRYERKLAYVAVGERDVGAALLSHGLARAKSYSPNTARDERYRRLEKRAQLHGRGIWGKCG